MKSIHVDAVEPQLEITLHRATALQHHCRLAAETMHPRFWFTLRGASIGLTVNSGYE
jgi:hypothetical protein